MRKTYHLCLSSHDEVLYRSESDLIMGFNCLAAAILATESRLLAEGFMTTHRHALVQTDSWKDLSRKERIAYARYFNTKYHRSGRLGEKYCFYLEIDGIHHTLSAANYVIRQGLHHGLSASPFGYPHCSANAFFRHDLGKNLMPELMPDKSRYKFLPSNVRISTKYRMGSNGLLLREDVIDVPYVEQLYITPRNYLFQMNRLTADDDIVPQQKENALPPVTLDAIECGVPDFAARTARVNEQGRVNRSRMTDLELCAHIDGKILPRFFREGQPVSIYLLSSSKRADIGNMLMQEMAHSRRHVTENQLRRCLCL